MPRLGESGQEPQVRVILGDCLDVLPTLAAGSVDCVLTDPPYGLEFMGKEWDKLSADFKEAQGDGSWSAAHGTTRKGFDGYGPMPSYVLPRENIKCPDCGNWRSGRDPKKPNRRKGYRCVCDGWRREQIRLTTTRIQEWYARHFTALLPVVKPGGYLLAFGGTRTWHRLACALEDAGWEVRDTLMWLHGQGFPKGKGCLKPAWEPIILARKPGPRVLPLGVDECRVPIAEGDGWDVPQPIGGTGEVYGFRNDRGRNDERAEPHPAGRWPANLVLSEEAAALLDEASGERRSSGVYNMQATTDKGWSGNWNTLPNPEQGYADSGGASRFFYCAKASRSERGEGNSHPTVKPLALMKWLVRLICPPGGLVLDPFAGSGTTLLAAVQEGRRAIGIEKEAAYVEIIYKRLETYYATIR